MSMNRIFGIEGKLSRNRRLLMLSLLCLPLMQACQQTELVFTDTRPPALPVFNALKGAPQIVQVNARAQTGINEANTGASNQALVFTLSSTRANKSLSQDAQASQVTGSAADVDISLHLFPVQASKLNYIELVLVNTSRPFNQLDILTAALTERAYKLAAQSQLTCIESLQVKASMHSIRLLLACSEQETAAAIAQLSDLWRPEAFDKVSLDNLTRRLLLNKHINAFSGGEIDKVWAKLILGEQHRYNLALDNRALLDNLSHQSLRQLQHEMNAGSSWHLLLSVDEPTYAQQQTELTDAYIALSRELAKRLEPATKAVSNHLPAGAALPNNLHQTLYIIDVPGAVQTQVRVGYALPLQSNSALISQDPVTCHLLASWLGRSFSGRLYYDLREQRGLTYGIYGRCFNNPLSRTLKYYGSTQLAHSGAFVAGILAHLQLAQSTVISMDELAALKLFEQSKFTLANSSQAAMKNQYVKHLTLGLSQAEALAQQAQIQRISPKQLQHMAQNIFHAPPMILLRGDLNKIRADLNDKLPDWQLKLIEP